MFKKKSISSIDSKNTIQNLKKDYYDYLCKIILIGPSGSGKTSILHRFVKGEFPTLRSQTIGVEFSSKVLPPFAQTSGSTSNGVGGTTPSTLPGMGTIDGAGVRLKLQLWDTAGQERFRSLTRSYYRGACGIVMAFDLSDKQTLLELKDFVLDAVNLTEETVSVIIVGNKLDLVGSVNTGGTNWVTDHEIEEFLTYVEEMLHSDVKFLKVSALEDIRVTDIFQKLASSIITKVELGILDPENASSGVQFGNIGFDLDGFSTIGSINSSVFLGSNETVNGGGKLIKRNIRISSAFPRQQEPTRKYGCC